MQTEAINTNLVETFEAKMKPLVEENIKLKAEVVQLKSQITKLERSSRRSNLLLHGIPETENNQAQLIETVVPYLNGISEKAKENEWDRWEISDAYRLGKKTTDKPRPILITTTLVWRKNLIIKNSALFPKGVYATEDLPKDVIAANRALIPKMKEARLAGKYAIIKNGALIVKEFKGKEKRKRVPSSPPSTPPEGFGRINEASINKQPTKLSKINPFQDKGGNGNQTKN